MTSTTEHAPAPAPAIEVDHDPALLRLESHLASLPAAVVAYSGGVDSTLLAAVAHSVLGTRALLVTAVSPALAARDLERAVRLARERGWNHELVTTAELDREGYVANGFDRCFWCKTELFSHLTPIAERLGAKVLVGTNSDDLGDHRPGGRAATTAGALTPLADSDLTKAEVRRLSRLMGLPTAEQPASPCLASRLAYGVEVTPQRLHRVEAAEAVLYGHGFTELRVRDHGDVARIEVPVADLPRLVRLGSTLSEPLRALGFAHVSVDLDGFRSGSLNAALPTGSQERQPARAAAAGRPVAHVSDHRSGGTVGTVDAVRPVRPDAARRGRTGVPEVVFAESKTVEQCAQAFVALLEAGVTPVIATRVSPEQAAEIARRVPDVIHDPVGRLVIAHPVRPTGSCGRVAVLSGGTSDLPVVAECAGVLEALGVEVDTHIDVGVAGLHRLLDVLPALAGADVLVAAAGMEGALPTVLAGLVDQPVIAVPVSVGYGVAAGGRSALDAMLASCAPGLTVVNIDNGFGAAVAAARIVRRIHPFEIGGM